MFKFIFARHVRVGLLAAILTGVSPMVLAGPAMPHLDDPQLQGLLGTLTTEYEQYLSSGNHHLVRPSEAKPWPCQLNPEQLNKIAGTTNSDDDPVQKRAFINQARSFHIQPNKVTYTNQNFYPVQATCNAGKLEGPIDFWVEYDKSLSAPPLLTMTYHILSHIRFTAKNGNAIGLVLKDNEVLKLETTYNDPANAEMMSKQPKHNTLSVSFEASWVNDPPISPEPMVAISHVDLDSNGKVTLNVHTVRPFGGNRYEETQYSSFLGIARTQYKDYKLHGLRTISSSNFKECWEDGEKIMADPCTVD